MWCLNKTLLGWKQLFWQCIFNFGRSFEWCSFISYFSWACKFPTRQQRIAGLYFSFKRFRFMHLQLTVQWPLLGDPRRLLPNGMYECNSFMGIQVCDILAKCISNLWARNGPAWDMSYSHWGRGGWPCWIQEHMTIWQGFFCVQH